MTTLCQLNQCLLFSSDAAGHLLSLDIDLYFNCANTTENNQSITGWGHVSPGTCGALLANPFIPAQGIHYTLRLINVKMSSMHIWGWKPFRGHDACVCAYLFECVQKHTVSAFEGLCSAIKSHVSRDVQSVIVSLSAQNESSVRPFLKGRNHKKPPLPLARNVPALPQSTLTRSAYSWQGNSSCVCLCTCRQGLALGGPLPINRCVIIVAQWSHKPNICPFKALEHIVLRAVQLHFKTQLHSHLA